MLSGLKGAVAQSFRSKRVQGGRSYVSSCAGAIAVILVLYCSPARAETRVLLLRGWFGVFSTGLDTIADALKAKGIRAEVAGHLQWKAAADEIRRERAQGKTDAIVLVGHSQGANNVIDMARVLEAQNVPIALLVTLAPTGRIRCRLTSCGRSTITN